MNHVTLHVHRFIYKTAVRIEIMVAAVGVMDWFYLYNGRGIQYCNDCLMIFGGCLTRGLAGLWRLVAPPQGIPQTPVNTFPFNSMIR